MLSRPMYELKWLCDSFYRSHRFIVLEWKAIAEQSAHALPAAPWLMCRNAQAATKLAISMISTEYYRSFLQRAGHCLSVAGLVQYSWLKLSYK